MSSVGLDIGGTFLKAAWLDDSSLQVIRRPIPAFIDDSGKAREIDPDALMASIHDVLDEVIGSRPCERMLITGQMAGLALIDEHGRALRPLISWQDTRFDAVEDVRGALSAEELASLGDGLRVGLPLVTLHHLTVPSDAFITSLLGYVAGALAGTRASTMHATDAAALGLLDVAACRWSTAALAIAHLESDQLPHPVADVEVVGTSTRYGAQVMTAVGDAQAALLGSGLAPGQISMNIATGCQVSIISTSAHSPAQLRPYFGGRYLHTVTHLPAGRLLRDAIDTDLGHAPSDAQWQETIQRAADDETATRRALVTIADACVEAAGRLGSASEIIFSGGLAQRIPLLRELITQQLDLPYSVFPGDDAALAGLRRLAQV